VLSGSVPACLEAGVYGEILERLAGRGICTLVDTAGKALEESLKHRPFLVKPNHHELGEFFGISMECEENIISAARELQKMGPRNVLVSMAERGALLLDETGTLHRALCPEGTVVSSVGAGDSMVAGFLAGFVATGDHAHALRLGIAAGSATAFREGLASREEILALLEQTR
jgi:1-phosphofructokinase